MIQRRLYIYIVAAASLGMLLIGLVNLGTTALDQLFRATPIYTNPRDSYAGFGAVTLVGLPVWGIHWWIAQRLARRNLDERASALRRLYLYAVLAATGVATATFARGFLEHAAGFLLGTSNDGPSIARAFWGTVVLFALWLYHFRTAAVDRTIAGESGNSATLRRWYAYGLLVLGLAFLLFGARNLLQQVWILLVDRSQTIVPGHLVALLALATLAIGAAGLLWTISDQLLNALLNRPVAEWRDKVSLFITLMLVGAPMWLSHWRASPAADERYTLSRRLYLYASLLGSVLAALIAGAVFVYRLLALLLGTSDAAAGAPLVDMGKAASVIVVAAAIGLYHWRALRSDAAARPVPVPRRAVIDRDVHLIITGASEDEVRRLLGGLPEGASYSIDTKT